MNIVKNTQIVFGLILFISTGFAYDAVLKSGGNHQASAELLANPEAKADYIKTKKKTATQIDNYKPIIPDRKEWMFVYDFIMEELEEYKEACEKGDLVEILDLNKYNQPKAVYAEL